MKWRYILLGLLCLPALSMVYLLSQLPLAAGGWSGGAAVVIDAVLYDGYEAGDADEAVRLRNVSAAPVSLAGWGINDGESATAVLPLTTTLAPGATIWLAKNGVAFTRQFGFAPDVEAAGTLSGVPQLAGTWPNLANSGDQVLLLDHAALLVDCLAYEGNGDAECGSAWNGDPVWPYRPSTSFAAEGQILYRRLDQLTTQPLPDSDSAADWAQSLENVTDGRRVMYPGWDLDTFFATDRFTETAVLTIAVAPDNAYEAIVAEIERARDDILIETQTFENLGVAEALLTALGRGVHVTVLLEGGPVGGISDQERYVCFLLADAGGRCHFMINDSAQPIRDRYAYLHAKFLVIDGERAIVSSENLSPRSLPYDDKTEGTVGRRGVVLITDAPGVIQHLETVFARDFDPDAHHDITGTHILGELPPNFVPMTVTGGTSYTVRFPEPLSFQGALAFEIVQSPENSLRTVDGLLGLVATAGAGDTVLVQQLFERPYWGASSSNAAVDPNVRLEAYLEAARRGATVRLLLDSLFDDGGVTSNTATCTAVDEIARLEALDIVCKTANPTGLGIHNKMVLVESAGRGTIHVGSINGSELSSKGNRELALQVQSDAAFAYLSQLFWHDWGSIHYLPIMMAEYDPPARHLLISELLYDPPGAIDDTEFIELVNPTGHAVDLTGFALGDAVARDDFEDVRRFPHGYTLAPGQTVVVATASTSFAAMFGFKPDFEILDTDGAVPDLVDDLEWGDPNALLRLGNAGDEVILRDPRDWPVDIVVYGTGQYPGITPCAPVSSSGYTLERFPYWRDSDQCLVDFREWAFPNPGQIP